MLHSHPLTLTVNSGVQAGTTETASSLAFRAATIADRARAMEIINSAYMEEAYIKMPFAQKRINAQTFDAVIANESGSTVKPIPFAL